MTKEEISKEISDLVNVIKKYSEGDILALGPRRFVEAVARLRYLRVMQTRLKRDEVKNYE